MGVWGFGALRFRGPLFVVFRAPTGGPETAGGVLRPRNLMKAKKSLSSPSGHKPKP